MVSILIFSGVGFLSFGVAGMVFVMLKNDLVPKKAKDSFLIEEKPLNEQFFIIPEGLGRINADSDLEKKYIELTLKHELLQEELKKRELEDELLADHVKNTLKSEKYSRLAEEILNGDIDGR